MAPADFIAYWVFVLRGQPGEDQGRICTVGSHDNKNTSDCWALHQSEGQTSQMMIRNRNIGN